MPSARARLAASLMIAAVLLPGSASAYEAKDCTQDDSHVLALRACTALLDAGGLDDATRQRYLARRGLAWLADDDGADAARDDFNAALKVAPDDVSALKGRARALTLLGLHDEAAADWTRILATPLDTAATEHALMERGSAQRAAGHHEAALADFAKALEVNARSERAHMARAEVYEALKDRPKVLEEYEKAHAINGGSYELLLWRAQLAERWGETQSAISFYGAALKIDPRKAWDARKSLKRLGIDYPSE